MAKRAIKKRKKKERGAVAVMPSRQTASPAVNPPGTRPNAPAPHLVKIDLDLIVSNLLLKGNREFIQDIIDKRNGNDLVSLVLRDRAQLMPNIMSPLFDVLRSIGKKDNIDLFISTTGGATEVPWRIVSLIREFCKKYTAIIPFLAVSAGTHIALGADTLVMSEISTLGPVDPTTHHPLLPKDEKGKPIPVSVEDLKNCIKFISQQLKDQNKDQDKEERYSSSDMTNIVGKLFEHIEPLAIGAVERSYALSRLVTRRVLETHLDPAKDKEKINRIVNRIGGEYFSHAFPITVRDVEHDLQLDVERPSDELFDSIWTLYEYYRSAFRQSPDIRLTLGTKEGGRPQERNIHFILNMLGYVDSVSERRVLVELREMKKDPDSDKVMQTPVLTKWIKPKDGEPSDASSFFEWRAPS